MHIVTDVLKDTGMNSTRAFNFAHHMSGGIRAMDHLNPVDAFRRFNLETMRQTARLASAMDPTKAIPALSNLNRMSSMMASKMGVPMTIPPSALQSSANPISVLQSFSKQHSDMLQWAQ